MEPSQAITLLFAAFAAYCAGVVPYNLWFHPLRHYPGPLLARCSLLWRFQASMSGRLHRAIEKQHQRYGPVFRVSPNELSFASTQSWKAIYGTPPTGQQHCVKSEFYDVFSAGYGSKCIGSERNPQRHTEMKRVLTPAFSTKALTEQEDIVRDGVDRFLAKIREKGSAGAGLNMTRWFEMLAFDMLGEMAFGQSFGCIEDEKPHFWFEMLTKYLLFVTLADNLRRYPILPTIGKLVAPFTSGLQQKQQTYTRQLVEKRLRNTRARPDFMTNIVDKVKSGDVPQEEFNAHASTLVIAGGETIASFFAAASFYLCTNRHCLAKLQGEIRHRFNSAADINATAAGQLPYLQAVIQETLRIFPPGSQGFPRISPGIRIDGNWVPRSTEIYTSAWTITHDSKYFHEPYRFLPERWLDFNTKDSKEASQPFSLGPRTCLGRNSGIGLATAKILAAKGCKVLNLDPFPPPEDLPESIQWHKCNQASWDDLLAVFEHAPTVDIAVANGGITENPNYFEDSFDERGKLQPPSRDIFDINFVGSINFVKIALSRMRRQPAGGSIVLVSSATGYCPEHSLPVYAACKSGILGLMRTLRSTTMLDQISINTVSPAATITNQLPGHLAAPIIASGLPVSDAEVVGWAIYYSATAKQEGPVELYGTDRGDAGKGEKWNGRNILTMGNTWTETEAPLSSCKDLWWGRENNCLTRDQQTLTDQRVSSR